MQVGVGGLGVGLAAAAVSAADVAGGGSDVGVAVAEVAADVAASSSSLGPHALNASATIIKAITTWNFCDFIFVLPYILSRFLSRHLVGVLIIFAYLGC